MEMPSSDWGGDATGVSGPAVPGHGLSGCRGSQETIYFEEQVARTGADASEQHVQPEGARPRGMNKAPPLVSRTMYPQPEGHQFPSVSPSATPDRHASVV